MLSTCIQGLGETEDVFFVFLIYTPYLESNSNTIIHEIKEVFHNNRPQVSTNFFHVIENYDAIVLLHQKSPQGCADCLHFLYKYPPKLHKSNINHFWTKNSTTQTTSAFWRFWGHFPKIKMCHSSGKCVVRRGFYIFVSKYATLTFVN